METDERRVYLEERAHREFELRGYLARLKRIHDAANFIDRQLRNNHEFEIKRLHKAIADLNILVQQFPHHGESLTERIKGVKRRLEIQEALYGQEILKNIRADDFEHPLYYSKKYYNDTLDNYRETHPIDVLMCTDNSIGFNSDFLFPYGAHPRSGRPFVWE